MGVLHGFGNAAFRLGVPDTASLSIHILAATVVARYARWAKTAAAYCGGPGQAVDCAKRRPICSFASAVACRPEDVVVTAVPTAFDLLARIL